MLRPRNLPREARKHLIDFSKRSLQERLFWEREKSPQAFERHTGLKGVAHHYEMPAGWDETTCEEICYVLDAATNERWFVEKIYNNPAVDWREDEWKQFEKTVATWWKEIVAANPELEAVPEADGDTPADKVLAYRWRLEPVNSLFPPDDIAQFLTHHTVDSVKTIRQDDETAKAREAAIMRRWEKIGQMLRERGIVAPMGPIERGVETDGTIKGTWAVYDSTMEKIVRLLETQKA